MSADGRFVVALVYTRDTDLVPDSFFAYRDVYLIDLQSGDQILVSEFLHQSPERTNRSASSPSISADGNTVVFQAGASDFDSGEPVVPRGIYAWDRSTRAVTDIWRMESTEHASQYTSVSADGRMVAFAVSDSSVVPNDTNGVRDTFVYDRQLGSARRVSLTVDGAQTNGETEGWLSADGSSVVLVSYASNMMPSDTESDLDVFLRNLVTGETQHVSIGSGYVGFAGLGNMVSGNGRYVTFQTTSRISPLDSEAAWDVYRYDSWVREWDIVSLTPAGENGAGYAAAAAPAISDDGSVIAYNSDASNFAAGDSNGVEDVFVADYRPLPPPLRLLVLGDSVSYGHGLVNPGTETQDDSPECEQACQPNQGPSTRAFPSVVAASLGIELDARASGCFLEGDQLAVSGAVSTRLNTLNLDNEEIENFDDNCPDMEFLGSQQSSFPHKALDPEELSVAAFSSDPPTHVSLLIGANDIQFAECLQGELVPGTAPSLRVPIPGSQPDWRLTGWLTGETCVANNQPKDWVKRRLEIFKTALRGILQRIEADAPHAQVFMMTYYQPMPEPSSTLVPDGSFICARMTSPQAQLTDVREQWYRHAEILQGALNEVIRDVADEHPGVQLIDLDNVFDGHAMCTTLPAIFSGPVWRAAHPTTLGQQMIADAVIEQLD